MTQESKMEVTENVGAYPLIQGDVAGRLRAALEAIHDSSLPVDVWVDHSLAVEAYARPDAPAPPGICVRLDKQQRQRRITASDPH